MCNGTNNTPDLRGRFIVGRTDPSPQIAIGDGGETGNLPNPYPNGNVEGNHPQYQTIGAVTGGVREVTLTANQSGMPAHTHNFNLQTTTDGQHTHNITTASAGNSGTNIDRSGTWSTSTRQTHPAGAHSHTVIGNILPTASQNAVSPHENRPPFYVLAFIKKIL